MRQRLLLLSFAIMATSGCGGGLVSEGDGSSSGKKVMSGEKTSQGNGLREPKALSNPLNQEFTKSNGGNRPRLPELKITNKLLNDPLLEPIEQKPLSQKTADKNFTSDSKEVLRTNFEVGKYLRDPHKKPEKNTYLERYGRVRLEKAATIKRFAPVTILPVQLEGHCSTAWDKGKLHVRIAYYGPQYNLNTFMNEVKMLYVSFQDVAGSPVYRFEIPIEQMKKAPPEKNFGQPTYEVEGQLPLELEAYEEFFQWTIEWD